MSVQHQSNTQSATQEVARRGRPWLLVGGCVALGGLALCILRLLQAYPERTESLFCRGLYPLVRTVLAPVGHLPFSLAEALLCLALVAVGFGLLRFLRGPRPGLRLLRWVLALAGLMLFAFEFSWGFHHARQPFARHAGWVVQPRSSEELADLVAALAREAAVDRELCLKGRSGSEELAVCFVLRGGPDGDARLHAAWGRVAQAYPVLAGRAVCVRQPLSSGLMSALGISGIYSPFTAEAHVNGQVPGTQVAFVTAHEVAHGRGFAREDEANFIAYLVCRASDRASIRYSGSLQALSHARSALARSDRGMAEELGGQIDPGVLEDLQRQYRFWRSKETILWEWSSRANDAYLKSQGQAEGVRSYGRMVDLLLAQRAEQRP
jgi:hypothetical protein